MDNVNKWLQLKVSNDLDGFRVIMGAYIFAIIIPVSILGFTGVFDIQWFWVAFLFATVSAPFLALKIIHKIWKHKTT